VPGACVAGPLVRAKGYGSRDTFTVPEGRKRQAVSTVGTFGLKIRGCQSHVESTSSCTARADWSRRRNPPLHSARWRVPASPATRPTSCRPKILAGLHEADGGTIKADGGTIKTGNARNPFDPARDIGLVGNAADLAPKRQDHHLGDPQHPGGGIPRLALRGADRGSGANGGIFPDKPAVSARAADQDHGPIRHLCKAHLRQPWAWCGRVDDRNSPRIARCPNSSATTRCG
jgi:hypothetical protein